MYKKIAVIGLMIICVSLMAPLSYAQELKIGVLANRGAARALREWNATAEHLAAAIGKPFAIVPLTYEQLPEWTKDKKIDFVCGNPAMFAEMNKLYGVQAIATIINQYKGNQMDQMAGTILVRRDSPIMSVQDMKGKEFGTAAKNAFGGWLMTERVLVEAGMNPRQDVVLRELHTHDNVIYAIMNKAVAAGSVRSGSLEKMLDEGKVKPEDFRIINQRNDGFPLLHSTRLYPEYPMGACGHVPTALREQVTKALIAIGPNDPAAKNAKIVGWKAALDYTPVVECLTVVKYGAFGR